MEIFVGLLTTFIGTIIGYIFKPWIQPIVRNYIYKDTNIDGDWTITYPEFASAGDIGFMQIKQLANKIWGDVHITKSKSKNELNEKYTFEGSISAGRVILIYQHKNRPDINRGSMSLSIDHKGKTLTGMFLFFSDELKKDYPIQTRKITAQKKA